MTAVGYGPLSYEWKKDGKEITHTDYTGTKSNTLSIGSFSHKHQGSYVCIVSSSQKSAKSDPASLILGMC